MLVSGRVFSQMYDMKNHDNFGLVQVPGSDPYFMAYEKYNPGIYTLED